MSCTTINSFLKGKKCTIRDDYIISIISHHLVLDVGPGITGIPGQYFPGNTALPGISHTTLVSSKHMVVTGKDPGQGEQVSENYRQ